MKKQTAIEWLMDKLPTIDKYDPYYEDIIQQALAMEKEQIVDAFDNGAEEWTAIEYSDGQHYYNHNFES
jgi:hypothetical protein